MIFRDPGSSASYFHIKMNGVVPNTVMPPTPVEKGQITVDLVLFDSSYGMRNPQPAAGTITVEYMIDGQVISPEITGPSFAITLDTTKFSDGTHIIAARIVKSTNTMYPVDFLRFLGQPFIIANNGMNNGAQKIPVTGFNFHSNLEQNCIDWFNYSGTPPLSPPSKYPYVFVPPSSDVSLRNGKNYYIEPLIGARHTLYTALARLFTTQKGGVFVNGYAPEVTGAIPTSLTGVMMHQNQDGARNQCTIDGYVTMTEHPIEGWAGVDIAGRLFWLHNDGSIETLAGMKFDPTKLMFDYRDWTVPQSLWQTRGTMLGGDCIDCPSDLCFDPRNSNICYITQLTSHTILKVDLTVKGSPVFSIYAGVDKKAGYIDGPSKSALFNRPYSLRMRSDGRLFVADFNNSAIRVISADGSQVTTLVGGVTMPPMSQFNLNNRDVYSAPGTVSYATSPVSIPYPQCLRLDSQENLVIAEGITQTVRVINTNNQTVTRKAAANAVNHQEAWIWLDVNRKGTVGPIDDILCVIAASGGFDTTTFPKLALWRIQTDGTIVNMGTNGFITSDGPSIGCQESVGHYPWIIAISDREARILTGGYGTYGLSSWRPILPTDHPYTIDKTKYLNGYKIFKRGTLSYFHWESRPPFTILHGEYGHGLLGLPNFDDLVSMSDADLLTYIQNGMGGYVKRFEITGNDARDLIYFIRRSSLSQGSLNPVSPGPDNPDKIKPIISGVSATRQTSTQVTISWNTDKPTLGFIAWGVDSLYNYRSSDIEDSYSTTHSMILTVPEGTFYGTLVSKDNAGNYSTLGPYII